MKKILSTMCIVSILSISLCISAMAAAIETDTIIQETTQYSDGLTIPENVTLTAPEGSSLLMAVDGVITPIQPGTYDGAVSLYVLPLVYNYDVIDGESTYLLQNSLEYVTREELDAPYKDGKVIEGYRHLLFGDSDQVYVYAPAAFAEASINGTEITGEEPVVVLESSEPYTTIDGVQASVNSTDFIDIMGFYSGNYIVDHAKLHFLSNGVGNFSVLDSGAVTAAGDATVIIKNSEIYSEGDISEAVQSGETATIVLMDSSLESVGPYQVDDSGSMAGGGKHWTIAASSYNIGMMGNNTEVPWVLGLFGTSRASNAIGQSNMLIYNSHLTSTGWGAISTDSSNHQIVINTDASIVTGDNTFDSGYGLYVCINSGYNSYLFGNHITGKEYGIIQACSASTYVGPSTPENIAMLSAEEMPAYAALLTQIDPAEIEEKPAVVEGEYGFFMHNTTGANVSFLNDTSVNYGKAAFLFKSAYKDSVNVTGTNFNYTGEAEPVLIQMMATDDPSQARYAWSAKWGLCATVVYPTEEDQIKNNNVLTFRFTDQNGENALDGNIYNSDKTGVLNLTLDHSELEGIISSASQTLNDQASWYIAANDAYDPELEESDENLKYICVDAEGKAYHTCFYPNTKFPTNPGFYAPFEGYHVNSDAYPEYVYAEEGTYSYGNIIGYCVAFYQAGLISDVTQQAARTTWNAIDLTVQNSSVWNVSGESYIRRMVIEEGSSVYGEVTVNEDGTLTILPSEELIPAGEYGIALELTEPTEEEEGESDGSSGGESAGGESAEAEGAGEGAEAEGASESAGEGAEGESTEAEGAGESAEAEGAGAGE